MNTPPDLRATPASPWRRYLPCALLALGLGWSEAQAAVVYAALVDDAWRIYYQEDLDAPPVPFEVGESAADARAPRLSPDASLVAFELTGHGLAVCATRPPYPCSRPGGVRDPAVRPAWSPAGDELVFVRYTLTPSQEDSELLVTHAERGESRPLLSMTGIQDYPDVTADGRMLVFSSGNTISLHRAGVQVVQHLWTTDLVSGRSRQISASSARDIHPRWSPDGARLAFASDRSGQLEIWTSAGDGSDAVQLTRGDGAKSWPAWSPDGTRLLFERAMGGVGTLWLIDLASGTTRQFVPSLPAGATQLADPDWR